MKPPTLTRVGLAAVALTIAAIFLGSAGAQPGGSVQERSRFIGTYTLSEYAGHGEHPVGRIAYDRAGRMWAMLLPPGRAPISNSSTPEEYRAAMQGLVAYYGTYDVDETTGRVVHHVEAASNPAWIGDDFVRWYRFEGDDLRLSLNPEFDNTLLWARLPQE